MDPPGGLGIATMGHGPMKLVLRSSCALSSAVSKTFASVWDFFG